MRLLIYIEPTSYLMPLCREILARSSVKTHIVFVEENVSQLWNIDIKNNPDIEVLQGNRIKRLMRLMQLMSQGDIELVDFAGWGHPLIFVSLFVARLFCIPVTIESDTQFYSDMAVWRRLLKQLLFPLFFRIPIIFFPGGTRQKAYFMRYGVPQNRIRIAQMTMDVKSFMTHIDCYRTEKKSFLPNEKPLVFLYVGRLESYKGVLELLEAFVLLSEKGVSSRLIIVGDGSLQSQVESFVQRNSAIEYLGRLTGEELYRIYSSADVFVLPSLREQWGLVVNEAMAATLAVIVTDRVGCADDLVCEGQNGFIVPSNSPEKLADAMYSFFRNPELAENMGKRGRKMISSWTIEDEARILLAGWDELKK